MYGSVKPPGVKTTKNVLPAKMINPSKPILTNKQKYADMNASNKQATADSNTARQKTAKLNKNTYTNKDGLRFPKPKKSWISGDGGPAVGSGGKPTPYYPYGGKSKMNW